LTTAITLEEVVAVGLGSGFRSESRLDTV
jgi:hypothetical protein